MTTCTVRLLGRMDYDAALALQNELVAARAADAIGDTLLIVEHPHVYTLGTGADESNLVWNEATRADRGVIVRRIDRGGDVTYHGAGQIVGYPIVALDRDSLRRDVVGYVRRLERLLLHALAAHGITGAVIPGLTGVWVDDAKIAAIGVRVTAQAVTKHGFALNVDPDLTYFEGIIPCGIRDKAVTSMARVLGTAPDAAAVVESLIGAYAEVFGAAIVRA